MIDQSRRVPADRGLSGLGLIMQLFGAVFAAAGALMALTMFAQANAASAFGRHGEDALFWIIVLCGTGIGRSLVHRAAGEALLYGHEPFAKIRTYQIWSAINVGAWFYLLEVKESAPAWTAWPLLCALIVWPVALGVIVRQPGIAEMREQVPHGEDHGFEGVSILMLMFGMFWTIFTGLLLYIAWKAAPDAHNDPSFMLAIIALVVLLIRSILHFQAGAQGLRETRLDQSVAAANRYADFGVVAAFVTGGCLLLGVLMMVPDMLSMGGISTIVWMLLAWPMIVRRFYNERQFADLMASPEGTSTHRRAPDLGLTTLGWFLLAIALIQLAFALPSVLLTPSAAGDAMSGLRSSMMPSWLMPMGTHSPWWDLGLNALQLWAAIELIRMSELHRMAATAFGAITTAANLYFFWPVLSNLGGHHQSLQTTFVTAGLALNLIVPITTLIVANRHVVPRAQARVRA